MIVYTLTIQWRPLRMIITTVRSIMIRWVFGQCFYFITWMYLLCLMIYWSWLSFITFSRWRNTSSKTCDTWLILSWSTSYFCPSTTHWSSNCLSDWCLNLSFCVHWWLNIINLSVFPICTIGWERNFSITTIVKIFWWFISVRGHVRLYTMRFCFNMLRSILRIIIWYSNLLSHMNRKTWWWWRKLIIQWFQIL